MNREESVQHFLDLLKKSRRGNFKVYIGMIAGVGKSYRMLSEAHELLRSGIDVRIGYIETHGRTETEALVGGLPLIPRRKSFYKGKEVEDMDLDAILNIHPEVVVVDELAHTNIEGSKNEKRWQDVMDILEAGISVITAVNIQHLEGLNEEVQDIAGIEVKERIPVVCWNKQTRWSTRPDRRRAGGAPESRQDLQAGKGADGAEQFLQSRKYPATPRTGVEGGSAPGRKESRKLGPC